MVKRAMVIGIAAAVLAAGAAWSAGGKGTSSRPLYKSRLFLRLPETCNTPDGMDLTRSGDIILSAPNYVKYMDPKTKAKAEPPALFKIDKKNKLTLFYSFPKEEGIRRVGPMGIRFGPDGNLYLADNQNFWEAGKHKSRLLRINVKNGKAVGQTVVATGLGLANGVAVHGDWVYVTDTEIKPALGGVFRFKVGETGVSIEDGLTDPHLVATVPAVNKKMAFSCDGIVVDEKGVVYTGLFGDGSVHKIVVGEDGKGKVTTLVPRGPIQYADGMYYSCGQIYVADSGKNAIKRVDPKTGKVVVIAENGDTTGADGGMDQPCEVIRRGNDLIVSDFDWPFPPMKNSKTDKPRTMSIIHMR